MNSKIYILIAFLSLISTLSFGQKGVSQSGSKEFVGNHGISVGGGIYGPSMYYWNEKSGIKDWSKRFNIAPYAVVSYENRMLFPVAIRLEGGYWKNSAEQTDIPENFGGGRQKIEISLIPITGSIIYYLMPNSKIKPYLGIGGGTCLVTNYISKNPTTRPDTTFSKSGQDFIFNFFEGIQIPITSQFNLKGEFRFALGSYTQEVVNMIGIIHNEKMSLEGPQFIISFNYIF